MECPKCGANALRLYKQYNKGKTYTGYECSICEYNSNKQQELILTDHTNSYDNYTKKLLGDLTTNLPGFNK